MENNTELLFKYKELLDNGIITQEEFEAKKNEILAMPETKPIEQEKKEIVKDSNQINPADDGSAGWAVLGALIPLVGLILFLVWNNTKPKCAKKAGIGALIGVGIGILCYMMIGCTALSYY